MDPGKQTIREDDVRKKLIPLPGKKKTEAKCPFLHFSLVLPPSPFLENKDESSRERHSQVTSAAKPL